ISSTLSNLPTGPVTVLAATALFVVSAVFAPNRGLLAKWVRRWRGRSEVQHPAELAMIRQTGNMVERGTE
ncbi:MAG: metal ABC transporter permease, partial [Paenibacillaceae bacterium]|nr:metal ABC transporter permease [Paenibacillaceae bacterium]